MKTLKEVIKCLCCIFVCTVGVGMLGYGGYLFFDFFIELLGYWFMPVSLMIYVGTVLGVGLYKILKETEKLKRQEEE